MSNNFLKIHEFWETLFPQFKDNYEFIYIYLDVAFVLVFIKLIISIPRDMLNRSKRI